MTCVEETPNLARFTPPLRAPFPWFGGKRRVADVVWRALGNTPNYVEPFAGSLAVLLARPHAPKTETVNDLDCYLANFWRAVAADPDGVARHADWPVNEADLSARHQWLVDQAAFRERMATDPDFFDAKIAGWWVWGLCSWIGSGWCAAAGLGTADQGVHRQLPHLGDAGLFGALSSRLRRVRVACGQWERVLSDSVTWRHGVTGVFLDPPYDDGAIDYAAGGRIAQDVGAWAREHGEDERLRIALCGYEGDYDLPGWSVHKWKAVGGYSSQATERNENPARERIWFSPHCLAHERQRSLFDEVAR